MSSFLGINFLFDKEEIERKIENHITNKKVTYVCAVNANTAAMVNDNQEYKKIINNSGFNICDGSLLALSYRKISKEPVSSYPGPDFFIDYLRKGKYKSFFLGSTDELLKSLRQKLVKYDPEISDMPFYSPPFIPLDDYDYDLIAKIINESNVDIIWVSLGAPKQEEFMYRLKPYLRQGVMIGVGAAFIFYGDDNFKRAPKIMRKMHLEWVYRNFKNPTKSFPRLLKQIRSVPILIYKELKK